jgi:hypothetical protein
MPIIEIKDADRLVVRFIDCDFTGEENFILHDLNFITPLDDDEPILNLLHSLFPLLVFLEKLDISFFMTALREEFHISNNRNIVLKSGDIAHFISSENSDNDAIVSEQNLNDANSSVLAMSNNDDYLLAIVEGICFIRFRIHGDENNTIRCIIACVDKNTTILEDVINKIEKNCNLRYLTIRSGSVPSLTSIPGIYHTIDLSSQFILKVCYRGTIDLIEFKAPNLKDIESVKNHIGSIYKIEHMVLYLMNDGTTRDMVTIADINEARLLEQIVYIKQCANPQCKGILSPLKTLSECGHVFCESCLYEYLKNYCMERERKILSEQVVDDDNENSIPLPELERQISANTQEQRKFLYLYDIPTPDNVTEDSFPQLGSIKCILQDCKSHIVEIDLNSMHQFGNAFVDAHNQIAVFRSYQYCCLKDFTYCDDNKVPLSHLMSLSCGHFFHPSCLAGWANGEIDNALRLDTQVICYSCKQVPDRICGCMHCHDRPDFVGSHIFNDDDAAELHKRCPTLFDSKSKSRWYMHSNKITVKNIASATNAKVFDCKCGWTTLVEQIDQPEFACSGCGARYCPKVFIIICFL